VVAGVDTYELFVIQDSENPVALAMQSDILRMKLSKERPNMCYVDTDCFLAERFVPPCDGMPYFSMYEYSHIDRPLPDPFYYFVNGRCDYFEKYFSGTLHTRETYGFTVGRLESMTDYQQIPSETFIHCYITMSMNAGGNLVLKRMGTPEELDGLKAAYFDLQTRQAALVARLCEKAGA
jgi:hypothetical protein